MIACRADFCAANPRVERVVSPFDFGVLYHVPSPSGGLLKLPVDGKFSASRTHSQRRGAATSWDSRTTGSSKLPAGGKFSAFTSVRRRTLLSFTHARWPTAAAHQHDRAG